MNTASQILILIPAYNEGEVVKDVVNQARQYLPVLVVNDGSTDKTAEYAAQAGATVINQQPNQGKGAALKAGFKWALSEGYQAVITVDADGQHDPTEIPDFLDSYKEQPAAMIIGERDFSKMPFSRRLANTLGGWAFSWALGEKVNDNQSGFRLISKSLMEEMLENQEEGFELEVEMFVSCAKLNWQVTSVPIRTIYGDEKSHISPLKHVANFWRVVQHTRQRMKNFNKNC
ncbi:MAG: glycosyltransferase family 2 protein [Anaerolineaceae bacterium]|nr:glycosyltransferase family 2 protein [Anaerolineaceae bacterium]